MVRKSRNGTLSGIKGIKYCSLFPGKGNWISFLFLLLSAFLLSAAELPAETRKIEGPVNIEADTLDYAKETDTYHAQGNVVIRFTDGILQADSVTLSKSTNEALAEGKVFLKSGGDTLEGDTIRFNIDTKNGTAQNGRIFLVRNHVFVKGSRIEKEGEANYRIFDGTATTCNGANPD